MGEIAEGMVDGSFCQGCGEYLGEGDGFPQTCSGCGGEAEPFDFDLDDEDGEDLSGVGSFFDEVECAALLLIWRKTLPDEQAEAAFAAERPSFDFPHIKRELMIGAGEIPDGDELPE